MSMRPLAKESSDLSPAARACIFEDALEEIDVDSMFDFLRRGEFGRLTILGRLRDSEPTVPLRGQKHSIDQV